jgi:type I restriction enzyme M protein
MNTDENFISKTKALIDNLKAVCANYGLGNDGNEFKIITQVFLYKFINDKFRFEAKAKEPKLAKAENFHKAVEEMAVDKYQFLIARIGPDIPKLYPKEMISFLITRTRMILPCCLIQHCEISASTILKSFR